MNMNTYECAALSSRRGRGVIDNGPEILRRKLDELARRKADLANIVCPYRRRVEELAIKEETDRLKESHRLLGKIRDLIRGNLT